MSAPFFYLDEKHHVKLPREFYIDERMLAAGLTYYSINNFYASTSVGLGYCTTKEKTSGEFSSSGIGFSFQIKMGREWWLQKHLSLGTGLSYAKTSVSYMNAKEPMHESIDSDHLALFLNISVFVF